MVTTIINKSHIITNGIGSIKRTLDNGLLVDTFYEHESNIFSSNIYELLEQDGQWVRGDLLNEDFIQFTNLKITNASKVIPAGFENNIQDAINEWIRLSVRAYVLYQKDINNDPIFHENQISNI